MESVLHQKQLGLHAKVATLGLVQALHFTNADNGSNAPLIPGEIIKIAAKLLM